MTPTTTIDLGTAVAAVRAAAIQHPVHVFLTGVAIEAWPAPSIEELLGDAETIYWQTPPPDLTGYDLVCEVGEDSQYRIEVPAPDEATR